MCERSQAANSGSDVIPFETVVVAHAAQFRQTFID
jgi:hypothetical protein